ncbi:autotransporter outer membrane beta-barrel domain-containing protein [Yersinia kristensenii]|uniref:autotransporter outer membrane beta-barrel domain-containing protein n=1 Tax=Yersinia kristensenii TaxID=28152 RepID=UPI0011AA2229|nr:autotransporter outer membrane beta-barrel domain-containing protein [Yersinia kristensenii]
MNSTPVIVLNGKPNILPALSQFRLHPMVLACAATLAFGSTTFPVRAADCSVNGTTYANCTQGQAGTSGINASGAEGTTGSNGNTAGNPTNAGTNGNNGGDATNTATSGGAGDVAATGGTLNITTGSLLAGGAGGAGGNANGGNGGNGGWPVQGSNANGGNGGDAGLSGVAQNGGMGGNAIVGSGFSVNNDGSIFGGAGGAGGNALGGAGGRGGQGANNFGHSGDGGDGTAGGIAGNGAAGGIAVTGNHFDLVSQGIIRGGNGGGAGLATGGAAGSTDLAGAPGGTMGSAGQAGADGTAGSYGAGGVAVISTGSSTITTSNIIAGGLAGDRKTQANAIELSGGNNTLTLESGYSFVGNVISSGGDTLVLGGDTNSSFSVASLAASSPSSWTGDVQYYGFSNYVKTGNSTWTLSGSTTEVTAWNINAGTLSVSSNSNLGAAERALTFGSGTLENTAVISTARDMLLNTSGTLKTDANLTATGQISGLGSLVKTGTAALILTNNNTYAGGTTINAGTLQIGNGGTTGSVVGDIVNNSALSFNRSDALTYGGVISGSGSLNQAGNDVLTLTGDNTYAGGTTISAGTLQIGNGGTTGSVAGDIINNSALSFSRSDALAYGGVISGSGSVVKAGNDVLTLTGNNTFTGDTTISAGTLQIGNGGTTGAIVGNIINNSVLSFNRSGILAYDGVISGSGSLVKTGNSMLILTGDNTFTGDTTISAGTLVVGNNTTGSVAGNIINNSALMFNRSDALTYDGVISGSGSLNQAGGGALTLTGNNTYTGGTVVNWGTLILQGVNAAGTGDITNNSKVVFQGANGEFSHGIYGTGSITFSGGSEVIADTEASVSAVNIDAGSKLTLLDSQVWQAGNGFSNAGTLVLSHLSRLLGNVDNSGVLALSNQQYVTSFIDGNLTNRGSLVLNPSSTSAGNNLTINGDYVGGQGSSLSLGAVLADDNSLTDQLTILGNSSGTSTLYMVNEKGRGGQTLQGLKLITVQGTSDAVFTQGNRITAGLYDYSLVKKENDWYLDSYTNQIRPEAASYAANLQAANTLFTLSLHDRAGETQYEDLVTGETRSTSMWMRNEGGRSKVSMTDGQNNTNTNRYVLQLGGDVLQVSSEPLGKFNLGVMAGYANARGQTYNSLKGYSSRNTITGYSTGIYSSWYANDQVKGGLYTDSWLQYNWFRNQVNGQEMAEEKYDSRGLTASLETGYDWLVNSWTTAHGIQNTLWLQPHAQAIWMGVKADGHTENQGSYVEGLGNNNVQTKLGLRAYLNGKSELDRNTERKFQPYVEANWVHNTNQYGVRIDGVDDHIKGARNAGELKTGVEAKLTERLSIQGGVSGQIGGNSYSDIAASLGGKFNF